jgi:hypothetical protein
MKEILLFGKNKGNRDGLNYECKECQKKYYEENKEKIAIRGKKYRQENSEAVKIRKANHRRENRGKKSDILRELLRRARARACSKKLPFDLTMEWIEAMVISHCPITLEPLDWTRDQVVDGKPSPNSPSIDKVKPELGYVQSNCAIISHRGNAIKSNGTIDEHRRVVQYMAAQQLRDTEF